MSITGEDAAHPLRGGIPIGDLGGGMFAVMGIQSALLERERSGKGQHVDISMVDVQISLLNYMATMYFLSGDNPHPIGNSHFVHVPYNSYPTQDGHLVVAVITDNFWQNLKQVVQYEGFEKPEFDGQPGRLAAKDYIDGKLTEIFATNTTEYWLGLLDEKRIPAAPVNKFSDALNDPQVLHRNMVIELKHPDGKSTQGPGNPVKLSRNNEESFSPAPKLGEHTDSVLGQLLGYQPDQISTLRQQGAIR
jgi:crotonobetainyl-CoA:carnitine CoA-transferase CaiB-like acyl-CoA transferase